MHIESTCPQCDKRVRFEGKQLGGFVPCPECGAQLVAPVDWSDLQGFVLITLILLPSALLCLHFARYTLPRWIGYSCFGLLLMNAYSSLPKRGHDSTVTAHMRWHIVSSVAVSATLLVGRLQVETKTILMVLRWLWPFPGLTFIGVIKLILDVVLSKWSLQWIVGLRRRIYALRHWPTLFIPPFTILVGAGVACESESAVGLTLGYTLVATSLVVLFRPHYIQPKLSPFDEVLAIPKSRRPPHTAPHKCPKQGCADHGEFVDSFVVERGAPNGNDAMNAIYECPCGSVFGVRWPMPHAGSYPTLYVTKSYAAMVERLMKNRPSLLEKLGGLPGPPSEGSTLQTTDDEHENTSHVKTVPSRSRS